MIWHKKASGVNKLVDLAVGGFDFTLTTGLAQVKIRQTLTPQYQVRLRFPLLGPNTNGQETGTNAGFLKNNDASPLYERSNIRQVGKKQCYLCFGSSLRATAKKNH
ncbi:MAG: hypothetical protein A2W66_00360 [Deltaproteobacteria bacterium RIFCSPLOWO2_02_56_12]|nr:MAG: hypothetical protein A2W66_00360 [Deltaproteobacteria bacterium RIFCSPLOWO2_02_56_12]